MFRIEIFITSHDRYQIFGFTQINNIMCPSRNHIYCFHFISTYFKFNQLSCINISFLNQSMPMNYNKLFPFTIMPMLSFGNPRFAYID